MTIKEALQMIDDATQPANAGKISRSGYHAIDVAIATIKEALEPKDAKVEVLPPQ